MIACNSTCPTCRVPASCGGHPASRIGVHLRTSQQHPKSQQCQTLPCVPPDCAVAAGWTCSCMCARVCLCASHAHMWHARPAVGADGALRACCLRAACVLHIWLCSKHADGHRPFVVRADYEQRGRIPDSDFLTVNSMYHILMLFVSVFMPLPAVRTTARALIEKVGSMDEVTSRHIRYGIRLSVTI